MNSALSGHHNLTRHILPSSLSHMCQNLSPDPEAVSVIAITMLPSVTLPR